MRPRRSALLAYFAALALPLGDGAQESRDLLNLLPQRVNALSAMRQSARQVVWAFARGLSATAASAVSSRKVNVSCRYRRTAASVWLE
jgi:hypothetical protein